MSVPSDPRRRETPARLARLTRQIPLAWHEIAGLRGDFWVAMALTGLAAATGLLLPARARVLVDEVLPSGILADVSREVGLLLAIIALSIGFSALRRFALERMAVRLVTRLRRRLFAHVLSVAPYDLQHAEGGSVLSGFTNDLMRYLDVIKSILAVVIPTAVFTVVYVSAMFWFSWQLSLTLVLMVVPLVMATGWFARRIHHATHRVHASLAALLRELSEGISGVREIKLFTLEPRVLAQFESVNHEAERALIDREKLISAHPFAVSMCVAVGIAAILLISAYAVSHEMITVGNLTGFLVCVALAYPPIQELSHELGQVAQLSAVRERLDAIMAIPSEPSPGPGAPQPADSGIRFERVSFGYPEQSDILQDLSFTIAPGERVAIVGPSGAGKSTLLELLPLFHRARSGRVLIGGVDIAAMPLDDLRKRIGLVLQVPFLFRATLMENLRAGAPDASPEAVMQAARDARVDEFASRLPQGYDTMLEPGGTNLSVGQRQRIAIARVFLKDPPILLLDEPTSALDAASEAHVAAALRNATQARTTLIVAHRLSTLRDVDRIIAMQDGRIVEQGSHAALLARDGLYAALWRHSQAAGREGEDAAAR